MAGTTAAHSREAQDRVATLALSLFQIHGYPSPSNDRLASIVSQTLGSLSPEQMRRPESITPASLTQLDQLVKGSVEAGKPFNLFSAEAARQAQQAGAPSSWANLGGGHEPTHGAFQRLAALRDREAGRDSGSSGGSDSRSSSSARYDGLIKDWGSAQGLAVSRNYAASNDMGWAMKDPDLMRMGKPALQALKESGLKGDGYQALRSPKSLGFDNPTIVKGADYMKRNKLDYDDAAKAAAAVHNHKSMTPEEKGQWKGAVGGALRADPGEAEQKAKQHLHDTGSSLKEKHPEMKPEVDKALEKFKADMGAGLKAKMERKAAESKPADPSPSSPSSPPDQQAAQKRKSAALANTLAMLK